MHNPNRGEIQVKIGGLELTLCPTFKRVSQAETAISMPCYQIANSVSGGRGLSVLECAVFLEQLTKPRVKRDDIGDAIMAAGVSSAYKAVGLVCERVLMGDDEAADDFDMSLPGEDDPGN